MHPCNTVKQTLYNGLNIFIFERDCNDEPIFMLYNDEFIKGRKTIILMKDGNLYNPIYKIDNDGKVRGMFNKSDPFIDWLNDQL